MLCIGSLISYHYLSYLVVRPTNMAVPLIIWVYLVAFNVTFSRSMRFTASGKQLQHMGMYCIIHPMVILSFLSSAHQWVIYSTFSFSEKSMRISGVFGFNLSPGLITPLAAALYTVILMLSSAHPVDSMLVCFTFWALLYIIIHFGVLNQ